jgi:hypothetical protein
MTLRVALLCLVFGFGGTGCTLLKIAPMVPEMADALSRTRSFELDRIYSQIKDGQFDRAEKGLAELERDDPTPAIVSEIAYIRAFMAERRGDSADALAKYRAVIANFPQTPDAYFAERKIQRLTAAPTADAK